MPLATILLAAWDTGLCTWEPRTWKPGEWLWFATLVQVTNARSNGWGVPSPWA